MLRRTSRNILWRAKPMRSSSMLSSRIFSTSDPFQPKDQFLHRHIGPSHAEQARMLESIGCSSLDELMTKTVPSSISYDKPLDLGEPLSESDALAKLKDISQKNKVVKSMIVTPGVILRNVLENPGWYTAYTPYQGEVAQGRLESLLNFQTMITDMTSMAVSNASLLDEATAAAEAMSLCHSTFRSKRPTSAYDTSSSDFSGVLVQYPNTLGTVTDYRDFASSLKATKTMMVCATDLLALTHLTPPGEFGADIAVGSAQRFGVPLFFGGPHAGFLVQKYFRKIPGRIIGVSKDINGDRCLRMAMQTREQHIRRDKATSNICTAQALLANIAAMYVCFI
eukprot:GSMAST32.ASY1.ANO1.2377.1 assembled CDS